MKHGFMKLAAGVPAVHVGAPRRNAREILAVMQEAYDTGAGVLVLPELCVTGYTCGDLFRNETLLAHAMEALNEITAVSAGMKMLVFVGVPLVRGGKLYNCAAAVWNGTILGVVPKSQIPNYGEFYELRHFTPAPPPSEAGSIRIGSAEVPFGVSLLFQCENMPALTVGCEICEDMWVSRTPGEDRAAQGATVLVNLSASNETIGKDAYRRTLVQGVSGRCVCTYVYADAGEGESTTDTVFSGHCLLAANGTICAENPPFGGSRLTVATVDLAHLLHDRRRMNTRAPDEQGGRILSFTLPARTYDLSVPGLLAPRPFIPGGEAEKDAVCSRILEIQSRGLAKRLRAAHAGGAVIALSGGLDSTLALIVTVRAMDLLARDRQEILAVTLPCFGTTSRTRGNAEALAEEFGVAFRCIDIREAVDIHFRDLGHNPADHSVVYENAQARERTQIIMDLANENGSLVIGTGDLSELALGWATYNGDHMSNYGVNCGVPKTLVRHIVSYYADVCAENGNARLAAVLRDILATPVSPELLPPEDGDIAQRTEEIVGPYDLHDFFLYHFLRWGEDADKIRREAEAAFAGEFTPAVIDGWLKTFLRRFYTQQFKRSALPDGPKVGSVALSPRGDWRMPSDAEQD